MSDQPLLTFKSHIEGKNADVTIYVDRVEWKKGDLLGGGKLARGIMTGGRILLAGIPSRQEGFEVIPVKSISSVTSEKDGLRFTQVKVISSGNTIAFRVSHDEATSIRSLLTDLMLGRHPSQTAPSPPPAPSPMPPPASTGGSLADELKKLAELRDAGVLTEDEFQAHKAKLLA